MYQSLKEWAHNNKEIAKPILATFAVLIITMVILAIPTDTTTHTVNSDEPTINSDALTEVQPKKEAKFKGTILRYEVINPATLQFFAKVKNTGNANGKFDCKVRGTDASGTYRGYDFFQDDAPLKPGKTRTWNGTITITNEGSFYVTEVTISC